MKFLNQLKKWLIVVLVVGLFVWIFGYNWSYVFKKSVVGEVEAVEKVTGPLTVLTGAAGRPLDNPAVSFSVAIKDRTTGEIFMASSEDRQWGAVSKGNCVVAVYFPYPPWMLSKANTSHNARLLRNFTTCAQLPDQNNWVERIKFFFLIP
jgi:hypothetical protein